ncbi:MAG: hypothetical protein M1497_01255 [Nitrospirae bacterium]|nr:hypothetical protein [Nitrospirota bacterium]
MRILRKGLSALGPLMRAGIGVGALALLVLGIRLKPEKGSKAGSFQKEGPGRKDDR